MFQKLLLCSDGSPCAQNAAQVALCLAQRFGSSVVVLAVEKRGLLKGHETVASLSIPETSIEDIATSPYEVIQNDVAPLFAAAHVNVQSLHARGHAVAIILNVAQREGCDGIVMGSHGHDEAGAFLFGSVSEGVLRHATCSVLIVPPLPVQEGCWKMNGLLLASDASAGAQKATLAAVELAAKFHAPLRVLNVYEEPGLLMEAADAFGEVYPQEQEQRVQQAIEHSMKDASAISGVACTLRLETGRPAETILRVVAEEKPDMVVVGHRGLGGFQSLLLGSVSGRVAQHSTCSVLVVR